VDILKLFLWVNGFYKSLPLKKSIQFTIYLMPKAGKHLKQPKQPFFMKKIILLFCVLSYLPGLACTTILIGSQCTLDGSTMLAHNEDMGYNAVGKLWHTEAKRYKEPQRINLPYIPYELKQTYAYWASGNAAKGEGLGKKKTAAYYDNVLVGMNEHGLVMACNWMHSKEEAIAGKGINRYALRQLILETTTTAEEAVKFIGQMIETYGQAD